jgi:hypothetical protein
MVTPHVAEQLAPSGRPVVAEAENYARLVADRERLERDNAPLEERLANREARNAAARPLAPMRLL